MLGYVGVRGVGGRQWVPARSRLMRDLRALFDPTWYAQRAETGRVEPFSHFLRTGLAQGLDPHPLFDTAWYRAQYPDVVAAGATPLLHFLGSGGREGRAPHPLFDTRWYLARYPDVAASGENPLLHFLAAGAAEGRDPHPLFDVAWYLGRNGDVASSGTNPLVHYLTAGAGEGRDPNGLFAELWYREANPAVARSGQAGLVHYATVGAGEGRDPHPLFDTAWYVGQDPRVRAIEALAHYRHEGARAGRSPNPLFDPHWYRQHNPDVVAAGLDPFLHFVVSGEGEGRDPHPLFDTSWYAATYPEVAASGRSPLRHYRERGSAAGCAPNPFFDGTWYLATYGARFAPGSTALADYLSDEEGLRQPNCTFDEGWYLARNPQVAEPALAHFIHQGRAVPLSFSPIFDARLYALQHGLVRKPRETILAGLAVPGLEPPTLRFLEEVDETALAVRLGIGRGIAGTKLAVGIVLYRNEPHEVRRVLASLRRAARQHGLEHALDVHLLDNSPEPVDFDPDADVVVARSGANIGFGAGHNRLMAEAFAAGADAYVGANPDGFFHPDALAHLLRMHVAEEGRALIEAAHCPEEHPKFYHPQSLETAWISGACFLVPRRVFEATGGFDPNIFLYCEDVDLSWSARRHGFALRTCPTARFYHSIARRPDEPWRLREVLVSGRYLGHKWGDEAFKAWTERQLLERGLVDGPESLPAIDHLPRIEDGPSVARFDYEFYFAPPRW